MRNKGFDEAVDKVLIIMEKYSRLKGEENKAVAQSIETLRNEIRGLKYTRGISNMSYDDFVKTYEKLLRAPQAVVDQILLNSGVCKEYVEKEKWSGTDAVLRFNYGGSKNINRAIFDSIVN